MDYQIILLPRQDYWSWVRACKDYVMTFGANLTPDPATAAAYMAPKQVITFPKVPDGFPEQGDLEAWFQARHPGIRLDVIEAQNPDELLAEFKQRVEDDDRYAQERRVFRLLWPTDYPVITQKFGANPQIYMRYGLPGHEGLDIRAPANANVRACADGTVYEVHARTWGHAYGIHVRISHRDGYKTVYAHLAKPLVEEGEEVVAGQVIGKADSTGNSSASHLHLTLKRDGATERGETRYPKDIIDPTAFMVYPESAAAKTAGVDWPAGRCLVGAHGRVGGSMHEEDFALVREARLEALKLGVSEPMTTLDRLREINPGLLLVARLAADFSSAAVAPDQFVAQVDEDMARLYRAGVRYFELNASPNLQVEGWRRSWHDGEEYARWFVQVRDSLRGRCADARIGFPGLSPGDLIPGQRADATLFLEEADEGVQAADWLGVNCFWTEPTAMRSPSGGLLFEDVQARFPDKLIFVTEFCNPSSGVDDQEKAQQYLEYFRMLRSRPGVGAAFAWSLSAASGHHAAVWRGGLRGRTPFAEVLGRRSF